MICKLSFSLFSLTEEVKNSVTAADGGKKENESRHFTSAPPSVNSTSIDQWEINALTAAVSVNEMFGGAIQKKKKKNHTHVASDSDKKKQMRIHTDTHTHTKTQAHTQLNKKQINRVLGRLLHC